MFRRFRRLRKHWVSLRRQWWLTRGRTWANDRIARQRLRIKRLKVGGEGSRVIRPENIVWIFGSGRTGSTWLSVMMEALPDHTRWHEPRVGHLFGHAYQKGEFRKNDRHFIFGGDRRIWLSSIRRFVLDQATAKFPQRLDGGYLVVK